MDGSASVATGSVVSAGSGEAQPAPAVPGEPRTGPALARALLLEVVVPSLLNESGVFVLAEPGGGSQRCSDPQVGSDCQPGSGAAAHEGRFASPRHAHGAHELCWVTSGRCVVAVGAQRYVLGRGDLCIVRPGEAHQLRPTPALEPFQTLWWHITAGGINLPLASFSTERRVTLGGFVALAPSPVPAVAEVVRELEGGEPHAVLLARARLLELAARLLRAQVLAQAQTHTEAPPLAASEATASGYVERIAAFVDDHYAEALSLGDLAARAGVSSYYLTTLFRRYTGRSVMAYVGDVRHREARSLLRNTLLDVTEVARSVGYEDPYYFSRVFRGREGCSPTAYRRGFTEPQVSPATGAANLTQPA